MRLLATWLAVLLLAYPLAWLGCPSTTARGQADVSAITQPPPRTAMARFLVLLHASIDHRNSCLPSSSAVKAAFSSDLAFLETVNEAVADSGPGRSRRLPAIDQHFVPVSAWGHRARRYAAVALHPAAPWRLVETDDPIGVGEYHRAQRDILAMLKQESTTVVTTMFDFYGMPGSWPGRKRASKASHAKKASAIEQAILQDIADQMGPKFNRERFLPYIQMHEFEALLFSRPEVIAEVLSDAKVVDDLKAIRDEFNTPEEIDDDPHAAPSKRIEQLCPAYQKPFHGALAARRIGIDVIRQECPHFNEWLSALESLRR